MCVYPSFIDWPYVLFEPALSTINNSIFFHSQRLPGTENELDGHLIYLSLGVVIPLDNIIQTQVIYFKNSYR